MNTQEKMIGIVKKGTEEEIRVTHVTIRQSIFFLILKLIFLELFAAITIILLHAFLVSTVIRENFNSEITLFNIPFFVILVCIKTILTIFVIYRWLNEYYEINPQEVIHRKGLIFEKEEGYSLIHISSLEIEQSALGKLFNYGTLKLYNWALEKDFYLYLIHNPLKYHRILHTLLPDADKQRHIIRDRIIKKDKL